MDDDKKSPLTREQERALIKQIKRGVKRHKDGTFELNESARLAVEFICVTNEWIIKTELKHFTSTRGLEVADLLQAGNVGIIYAAVKFNLRRHCRFITYARHWVRRSMRQAVRKESSLIRLPDWRPYVQRARVYSAGHRSAELSSTCAKPEDHLELEEDLSVLPMLLSQLTEKKRLILLEHVRGRNYKEIGEKYTLSKERVRQIILESKAFLKKLATRTWRLD